MQDGIMWFLINVSYRQKNKDIVKCLCELFSQELENSPGIFTTNLVDIRHDNAIGT